jgi:hypothetical protein
MDTRVGAADEPGADRLKDLAGAYYFAQAPWQLPLFQVNNLDWPGGCNVIYTDCIPACAILLKLANLIHPVLFNYFGVWVALCFVLNPVFFCWLLHELRAHDIWAQLAGAVFASCVPALLFRHGHAALCGHFLILAALAFYARGCRVAQTRKIVAAYSGLALFTLLVSVYLLAMVFAVYGAFLLQRCLDRRLAWRDGAGYLAASLALCLAAMFFCGHLSLTHGLPAPASGFGDFSMNLVSPFWPWQTALAFGGNIDATGGQYEGYNYLGAGVLALLVLHLCVSWRELPGLARRHQALLGVFGLLTLAALSCKIYFSHELIFQYQFAPLNHLMGNFRASGRFFWPVGYGVLVTVIVLTARKFSRPTAGLLLAGCAMLQAYDVHVFPRLGAVPLPEYARPEKIAFWEDIFSHYPRVEIYPQWDISTNGAFNTFIQYVASLKNIPINSAHLARPPADLTSEYLAAEHPVIRDNSLYLFQKSDYSPGRVRRFAAASPWEVWEVGECYLVIQKSSLPESIMGQLQPAAAGHYLEMASGSVLDFRSGGNLGETDFTGLYSAESWGCWTRGGAAEIETALDPALRGHVLLMSCTFTPFVNSRHPHLTVTVQANGREVAIWTFQPSDGAQVLTRTALIPAEATTAEDLRWRFVIHDPASPYALNLSGDDRLLGLGLVSLGITDHGVTP